MASYLKPRRGTASTAASKLTRSADGVLKNGEIFFELNASGAGKGVGKIMMGDGSTDYSSLQYFLSLQESPITFDASGVTDQIGSLVSGVSIPTAFKCIKSSLAYLAGQVSKLNNELGGYKIKTINFDATVPVANPYTKELWFSLPANSNILSIIGMAKQYYGWFAFSYNTGMTYSSMIVGIKNLYTSDLADSFAFTIFYKEPEK